MAEYHVGCGLAGIYAGTLKPKKKDEWQNKSCVTDEAIAAVRDYLLGTMEQGCHGNGLEWTRKDGKKITLMVSIHDGEEEST